MKTTSNLDAARLRIHRQLLGNPLRGLTPQTLSAQLDAFATGDLRAAAQTWAIMEQRHPMLGATARKRYRAVSRLPWAIKTAEDSPAAKLHAEVLERFWRSIKVTDALDRNRSGGVSTLLRQAARAIGHQWSVHEIVWKPEPGNLTAEFTRVPLWFFEARTGVLRFMRSDYAVDGEDLEPGGWLVHCGDGLMHATAALVVWCGLGLGDWLSYSEKYSLPGSLWKTSATKGSKEWDEAEDAAASFGADWMAVVSKETEVMPIPLPSGGVVPSQAVVEYLERRIATLWRGADLGTMSQGGDGVGASLQGDETAILMEDDADEVTEPLRDQVERYVIEWYFGPGVKPLAYLEMVLPADGADATDLSIDAQLVSQGVPLSVSDAAERYGRKLAADGEPTLRAAAPAAPATGQMMRPMFGNDATASGVATPVDIVAAALGSAFAPLRDRIEAISRIEDPDRRRDALLTLRAELPTYLVNQTGDMRVARAFERILSDGLIRGLLN